MVVGRTCDTSVMVMRRTCDTRYQVGRMKGNSNHSLPEYHCGHLV